MLVDSEAMAKAYQAALSGATHIQVVPVDTAQDALAWLKAHPQ